MNEALTPASMRIMGIYNWRWRYPIERLVYLGKRNSMHRFAKVSHLEDWCEVGDSDLCMLEETPDTQPKEPGNV